MCTMTFYSHHHKTWYYIVLVIRDSDCAIMVNFQLPSHNIFIFVDCTHWRVHNHHKLCASKIFASLINFPICSTTQFSMCSSAEVCFGFGLQHIAAQYLHWQENKNCNIFYEDEYDKNHSQNFRLPFVELWKVNGDLPPFINEAFLFHIQRVSWSKLGFSLKISSRKWRWISKTTESLLWLDREVDGGSWLVDHLTENNNVWNHELVSNSSSSSSGNQNSVSVDR